MERRKKEKVRVEVEHVLQRHDIENLATQVKNGFDGVHRRQDIANGKINKAGEDIVDLKNWRSFMQGGLAILALMVVPVFIYFITHWK